MRWLLVFYLFLVSLSLRGATGDIVGNGNITSMGVAEVRWEGFTQTNTPYTHGLRGITNLATYDGTNEIFFLIPWTTNGVSITLDSWGWWYGTNKVWQRTVYGTRLARKPYPNHAQSAIVTNIDVNNTARFSFWLNDFIYTTDSNLVGTIRANAFASNNAVSSLSFSNNSTIPPWTPKCNLLNYGWENIVNSNYTTRIVAYDHYKIDGVSVILTHTNGQTKSNYSMVRVPDNHYTRGQNAAVFTNTFDLSDWTNSIFTVDYIVRPRIGTPFSTYDNLYGGDAPQPQRFTNLLNHFGLLTTFNAVMDAGAVGPGAVSNVAPALIDPAHYFTNAQVASQRSASSNNYRGATVYWRDGTTNVAGSAAYTRDVDSRIRWLPYPGHTAFTLLTNTTGGGLNIGGRLQIEDCTIRVNGTTTTLIDNTERVVLSNCVIDSVAFPFRASSVNCIYYADACKFTRLGGGIGAFSTDRLAWQLVGCDLNGFTNRWVPWLAVGNWHTNSASTNFTIDSGPTVLQFAAQQRIFAHNALFGLWGDSTFFGEFGDTTYAATNDAVVLNIMEGIAPVGGAAKSLTLWASPTNMTGIVLHNNTLVGFRHQAFYNETGTGWKNPSVRNNAIDVFGWVDDAVGGANNTSYTNNWWFMFGVGMSGNVIPDTSEVFHGDFEGVQNRVFIPASANRRPYTWWGVPSRRALSSTTVYGLGNGNYHWMPYALANTMQLENGSQIPSEVMYEYDIDMKRYRTNGPPGVYAFQPVTTLIGGNVTTVISNNSAVTIIQK